MTAPARRFAADPARRAMLAKVHLAAKELGLDEDSRRDVIERVTGKRSAGDCSDHQLDQVLAAFRKLGWRPKSRAETGSAPRQAGVNNKMRPRPADHPMARKARALWVSLWQLGEVRNPADEALEAFAARQLGCERLQWADQGQSYKLIEALKAMAERAGWEQAVSRDDPDPVRTLKVRLVAAQWGRLTQLGVIRGGEPPVCWGLAEWAHIRNLTPCLSSHTQWSEASLDAVTARLGRRIREAAAK